jgi:hypothetical protein
VSVEDGVWGIRVGDWWIRGRREGEWKSEMGGSSAREGEAESTELSKEEIDGRSYDEEESPGRERFLFEARLF